MLIILLGLIGWGAFVGLAVGFTAIGKGLLGTPGLIVIFQMDPVIAVGTMAVAGAIMMIAGSTQHLLEKNVILPIAVLFSLSAFPVSWFTARYAQQINAVIPLKTIIGIIILLSVMVLFYRYVIMRPKLRVLTLESWKLWAAPFIGVVLGAILGATSISGSVIVIAFIMILKLPIPYAVGTTSVVSAIALIAASAAHIQQGNVDWLSVAGLVPGVLVGSIIGARYANRVPRQLLRLVVLGILFAAGIMIFV